MNQSNQTKVRLTYALTFLSGLLLGWLLIGWLIWPVAYVGEAYTYELNQQDKLRYASAVVDSFAATGIADPAWFAQWTSAEVNQTLEQVAQANPAKANWARALANQASVAKPVQVKAQNQASEVDLTWLMWLAASMPVIGGVVVGLWLIRRKRVSTPPAVAGFNQAFISRKTEKYIPVKPTPTRTLAHAKLTFGPTQSTDQHFPIESQQEGESSPGEFGVNQVDDQPAWDVWLFDQKALVTVTKVLADQESEELASRGEVVKWYDPIFLESPNLKMAGRVKSAFVNEMHQSNGTFSIELTVEAKDEN